MTWPGRVTITGRAKGHRQVVRLGDSVVPPVAVFEVEGADGAPHASARFEVRDGRPECVEISVKAQCDGRGIRSTDMGVFNLDNLATNVFAELCRPLEHIGEHTSTATPPQSDRERWKVQGDVAEARAAKRGGRGVPREELEQVARLYREHIDGAPLRVLRDFLGYSDRTAARRVQQARAEGLLPKTQPGRKKA